MKEFHLEILLFLKQFFGQREDKNYAIIQSNHNEIINNKIHKL